jgi:hypothetical protein
VRIRLVVVAAAIAVMTVLPSSPALATHSCGFEPGSLLQQLCENTPHTLFDKLEALICKLTPFC